MSKNVYQMVTERIIEELQNGVIPWEKPWTGSDKGAYNRISKKPYSLINQLLLKHPTEYATMKQWNSLGGKVKKGSKAEFVIFWKVHEYMERNEDGEEIKRAVPLLRYIPVFSINDIDGVEPLDRPQRQHEPIAEAEKVLHDYIAREHITFIDTVTNEAWYSPTSDTIHVPTKSQYERLEEYYSTAFHEAIHSTMLPQRCNRSDSLKTAHWGNAEYSREELCAECGASFILNMLGIETKHSFNNSVAYLHGWAETLKNDPRAFVVSACRAERACEFILHSKQTTDAPTDTPT